MRSRLNMSAPLAWHGAHLTAIPCLARPACARATDRSKTHSPYRQACPCLNRVRGQTHPLDLSGHGCLLYATPKMVVVLLGFLGNQPKEGSQKNTTRPMYFWALSLGALRPGGQIPAEHHVAVPSMWDLVRSVWQPKGKLRKKTKLKEETQRTTGNCKEQKPKKCLEQIESNVFAA